jgi:hypothetical protein
VPLVRHPRFWMLRAFALALSLVFAGLLNGCSRCGVHDESELLLSDPLRVERVHHVGLTASGRMGGYVNETYLVADEARILVPCSSKQRIRVHYDAPRRILSYRCDENPFQILYLGHDRRWAPYCARDGGIGAAPDLAGLRTWNEEANVLYRCGIPATVAEELRSANGEARVVELLKAMIETAAYPADMTDPWIDLVSKLSPEGRKTVIDAVCVDGVAGACNAVGETEPLVASARRIRACLFTVSSDASPCARAALRVYPRITSLMEANLMADLLLLGSRENEAADAACSVVTSKSGPIETLAAAAWMVLGLHDSTDCCAKGRTCSSGTSRVCVAEANP